MANSFDSCVSVSSFCYYDTWGDDDTERDIESYTQNVQSVRKVHTQKTIILLSRFQYSHGLIDLAEF